MKNENHLCVCVWSPSRFIYTKNKEKIKFDVIKRIKVHTYIYQTSLKVVFYIMNKRNLNLMIKDDIYSLYY
jgi:hypothetical protein